MIRKETQLILDIFKKLEFTQWDGTVAEQLEDGTILDTFIPSKFKEFTFEDRHDHKYLHLIKYINKGNGWPYWIRRLGDKFIDDVDSYFFDKYFESINSFTCQFGISEFKDRIEIEFIYNNCTFTPSDIFDIFLLEGRDVKIDEVFNKSLE